MKENIVNEDNNMELSNSESSSNFHPSLSMDSFLDDLLRYNAQTCTHTHTCNPPGPDAAHTHTCYHTHTQLIPSEEEENGPGPKPRKPLGNREAVRKYREKKKAHTAYLEEEVKKLRLANHQLMKRVQKQGILENECLRLRSLLVEFKGKIDVELGAFPFQKPNGMSAFKEGNRGLQSINVNDLSLNGGCGNMMASWDGNCRPPTIDCDQANTYYVENEDKRLKDSLGILVPSAPEEDLT